MNIPSLLRKVDETVLEYERLGKDIDNLEREITNLQEQQEKHAKNIDLFERSRVFLQRLAEITRKQIADTLDKGVTMCLQAVFGEHLRFETEIKTSRNNTAVYFYVVDTSSPDGEIRFPPEETMGGGVVDTCAFGLRFCLSEMLDPVPEGPFILDEPAKMVSGDLVRQLGHVLVQLSKLYRRQTIMVTHHEVLKEIVDNYIHVTRRNGVSFVAQAYQGKE